MSDGDKEYVPTGLSAIQALRNLREGNARFVDGDRCIDTFLGYTRLTEHVESQSPYAVVLGCSDSRVPVEIIFDVGLGELFVIRVAGNIVAPSLIGSVELAAAKFGARLVVVLGHTGCGAIATTIEVLKNPGAEKSKNIGSIVEWIRPSVEDILAADPDADGDDLINVAVRTNVKSATRSLRHGSELLETLIRENELIIVGAEYSLETGLVDFFDGVPRAHSL